MLTTLKLLYILSIYFLLALQAHAILGGKIVSDKAMTNKIIKYDIRLGSNSIICSGSFITNNKLLTAAHCLELLNNTCKQCHKNIIINDTKYSFKYYIHPNYKKRDIKNNYANKNNFDIAIIKINEFMAKETYQVNTTFNPQNQDQLKYFGYGMSKLEKKDIKGNTIYHESHRGDLRMGTVESKVIADGLLKKMVEHVFFDENNFLTATQGSQVLRSDSGGPLIYQNRIVGIIRNYEIIDQIEVSSKNRDISNVIDIKLKSTFTLLNNKKISRFLNDHLQKKDRIY